MSQPGNTATGEGWELRLGDWREVLADVECDAIICDPPYGARVHAVELECNDRGITEGLAPGYDAWTPDHVMEFVRSWSERCRGWMVALTSHDLVPAWEAAYADVNRYCFAPIPCVMRGMSVRMLGDGPSSWSVFAIVARPKSREFSRWGTLDGAYIGPRSDNAGGGRGKPEWLLGGLIRDYSKPGQLIADPLAGWGSTLAAAAKWKRRAIGAEVSGDAYAEALSRLGTPTQLTIGVA